MKLMTLSVWLTPDRPIALDSMHYAFLKAIFDDLMGKKVAVKTFIDTNLLELQS